MSDLYLLQAVRFNGAIRISGAKNAALPLAASLMTEQPVQLGNMPDLANQTDGKITMPYGKTG